MMRKDNKKKFTITWTKNITRSLLIVGVVCGMTPFVLSFLGKEPCVEMGIAWVTEIVAVALGYFVRGFKDTKEEEKVRLQEKAMDNGLEFINTEEEVQG